jgi:ribosome biogenesis protein YTM1
MGNGHVGAVKAVKILPRSSATISSIPFAISGGKDKTIHLWELTTRTTGVENEAPKRSYSLKSMAIGKSHADSVEALAVCSGTELFVSGGFDRKIILWNPNRSKQIENTSTTALRRAKKLRVSEETGDLTSSSSKLSTVLIPSHTLNAHTDAVTSLCFPFPTTLFSASLDRSVRQFDVAQGEQVNSWHGQLSINALAVHELGYVLATAHSDGTIRLRDTRADRVESGNSILRSHSGWVSDLRFSPLQNHMLVSGSYDKTVKLWDLRAKIPLSTLNSHTDKVLSVDWTDEDVIVSGGSDKQLKSHRWECR